MLLVIIMVHTQKEGKEIISLIQLQNKLNIPG